MRLLSSIHPSKRVAYVREDACGSIYGRSILYMAAQASSICEHKHLRISFFLSFFLSCRGTSESEAQRALLLRRHACMLSICGACCMILAAESALVTTTCVLLPSSSRYPATFETCASAIYLYNMRCRERTCYDDMRAC